MASVCNFRRFSILIMLTSQRSRNPSFFHSIRTKIQRTSILKNWLNDQYDHIYSREVSIVWVVVGDDFDNKET